MEFWPEFKGRDGCRTPMVWTTDNANGGFSDGTPWLPVKAPHLPLSVAAQEGDPASMLAHYRAALAFRRAHRTLRTGTMSEPRDFGDVVSFVRTGDEVIFCAVNLGAEPGEATLPTGTWERIATDLGSQTAQGGQVTLPPWGVCLARQV